MKIVFFGSPEYALQILETLHNIYKTSSSISPIVAVVTQKPSLVGRKQVLTYTPIDIWAYNKKIPVFYEPSLLISKQISADIGILVAYGEIISKEVIELFKYGIVNIHLSLLPKYRGASPIQAAIVTGDKQTGASIFKIDDQLDHGPIITQFKEEILATDTANSLRSRLFKRSADVLTNLLPAYISGRTNLQEQDDKQVSYTQRIKKTDSFIPEHYFNNLLSVQLPKLKKPETQFLEIPFIKDYYLPVNPITVERFIRAMNPWPICWTNVKTSSDQLSSKKLNIIKAHLEQFQVDDQKMSVTLLVPDIVQLEAKNPVSWSQFKMGYPSATFANA